MRSPIRASTIGAHGCVGRSRITISAKALPRGTKRTRRVKRVERPPGPGSTWPPPCTATTSPMTIRLAVDSASRNDGIGPSHSAVTKPGWLPNRAAVNITAAANRLIRERIDRSLVLWSVLTGAQGSGAWSSRRTPARYGVVPDHEPPEQVPHAPRWPDLAHIQRDPTAPSRQHPGARTGPPGSASRAPGSRCCPDPPRWAAAVSAYVPSRAAAGARHPPVANTARDRPAHGPAR